jgi:hypothetical protein
MPLDVTSATETWASALFVSVMIAINQNRSLLGWRSSGDVWVKMQVWRNQIERVREVE